jgi:N-acetylglucosamine kinase-like BadF-type ATPase
MSVRIAVGVDAGGTSTVAAASHDNVFTASGHGGPANPSSIGAARSAETIAQTVRDVAGPGDPSAIFVAAAGAGRADARDALVAALRAAFPATPQVAVEDDTRVALRASVPEGPGVVLVCGTGSVAYAENGDARVRVGGAGYLLGDEGSAFAIGFAAVRALARVYDGRSNGDETTALAARTLHAPDRDALLREIYGGPLDVARVAAMAPVIIAFADKGNRVATKIVQSAGQDLGELVKAAVRAAGLTDASPTIVFAGGLLRENSLLSFLLETRVVNDVPGCAILRGRDEPARAALRFAEALAP